MLSHTLSLCLTQITTKMAYSNQAFVEAAVLLKSYLHNTSGFTDVVILSLTYDKSESKFTAISEDRIMSFRIRNKNRIVEFISIKNK